VKVAKVESKKEDLPKPSLGRIMKLNAPEWQMIVLGVVCAAVNGGAMPAYGVLFGEVLGVRRYNNE
jgi:hypothetical protein